MKYKIFMGLADMEYETKIVVDIESTEGVTVELKDVSSTFYYSTNKVHSITFTRFTASYDISVTNPSLFGLGDSAVMTGSIKAYHVYEAQIPVTKYRTVPYEEWLPFWIP